MCLKLRRKNLDRDMDFGVFSVFMVVKIMGLDKIFYQMKMQLKKKENLVQNFEKYQEMKEEENFQ